jgi:ferredoxin-fold anticodon binding domain-containing protein
MEKENLTQWMNEFLQVGKKYVVFSVSGSAFVGVYKGMSYDYLLFKLEGGNNLYMNPNNIELIKEEEKGGEE